MLRHERDRLISERAPALSACVPDEAYIRSLRQTVTLKGHTGCVNRLRWNTAGSMLASVSDDCRLLLWDMRQALAGEEGDQSPVHDLDTGHVSNIFGVDFMYGQDDTHFITGAMDGQVIYHILDHPDLAKSFSCHQHRVKSVLAHPADAHVYFSAGEDGTLRQYDTRTPQHHCKDTILLKLQHTTTMSYNMPLGLKEIAIEPLEHNLVAVAASDQVIRVYDRRSLHVGTQSTSAKPVLAYSPCTLKTWMPSANHVGFSPDGNRIIASFLGNNLYTFNIKGDPMPSLSYDLHTPSWKVAAAQEIKAEANDCFAMGDFASAVESYNKAIGLQMGDRHLNAVLHANRSSAFYSGARDDAYHWALHDLLTALYWDPSYTKAAHKYLQLLQAAGYREPFQQAVAKYGHSLGPGTITSISSNPSDMAHVGDQEKPWSFDSCMQYFQHDTRCFAGASNVMTDIKEAVFLSDGKYIACGSDDGHVFFYDAECSELLHVLSAGDEIVNCVQPHPSGTLIATSGIEDDIRVYTGDYYEKQSAFVRRGHLLRRCPPRMYSGF